METLLSADAAARPPVDGPIDHAGTIAAPASSDSSRPITTGEGQGDTVAGRYKLLQKIGEGGMGTVWMADQTEPVRRRVAIKLIRVDRGQSKMILARFEAERQAIALMDHPHIAKLLDAGTTENGSPFFVMELVKGTPLNEYCDQHRLTIPQRLQLFLQICSAVQHAHQKGIIHRDLKPSNILVESHDGKPVPKIIDFGLAKATTGLQLTEQSLFTAFGAVMGTPLYMAPEQAAFNALDVDTRADIYALGVVLYELLTGTTPITREEIRKAALDEMLRMVREQEAPTPSSRLSSSDSIPTVAANRQSEPARLGRFVKGELDWIVLKALSKERDRRYETANGFAKDIERFLNHEPVTAGPPSAAYKLRKFIRRNRPQVIAAALILLALLAGVIGTTLGLFEARHQAQLARESADREAKQRQIAEASEEKAQTEKANAERNLDYARKGNELLGAVFSRLNPNANYATVAEFRDALKANLAKAVKELEGSAIGDPLEVASMQMTLSESLLGLAELPLAIETTEKARATREALLGINHPDTLASMSRLATCYRVAGKLDQALPLYEETLRLRKAVLGPDHPKTLESMNNLAGGYRQTGKLDLAVQLLEETLELCKSSLGPDHADTLTAMNNLAVALGAANREPDALPLHEEVLRLRKIKLGPTHPSTLMSMNNLARALLIAGKQDDALRMNEEALELMKANLGPDHPDTLIAMGNLASAYFNIDNLDKALPLYEETLKLMQTRLGPDHPHTLQSMHNLAMGYEKAGQLEKAISVLEETVRLSKAKLGSGHPSTISSMRLLAKVCCAANRGEEASAVMRELVAEQRKRLLPDDLRLARLLAESSLELLRCRQFAAVEEMLRECLKIREAKAPDAWSTFNTMSQLGGALLGQK